MYKHVYIYVCFKYHICIVVFWIYIRISIHIICTWSRSARKKPTALFQSPQETALPFHSALQSGGKIAGFRAGIQCFFKLGWHHWHHMMTSTYVTPPILEGIGSFKTLKPATPQHGYTVYCFAYTFCIFMWGKDVTWISTALAWNETNRTEPNLSALCLDISRGVPVSRVDFFPFRVATRCSIHKKNMWREFSEKLLMLALSSTTVWKTSRPCRRGKGIKHLSLIDASMPGSCWITLPHLKSRHSLESRFSSFI